jgi:signal transduction histidine kinase
MIYSFPMDKRLIKKIIICLTFLFLIPVLDGIYIVRYLYIKNKDAEKILDHNFRGVTLSEHLNYLTNEADAAWKEFLITGEQKNKDEYQHFIHLFNTTLEDLSFHTDNTGEGQDLIAKIKQLSEEKIDFFKLSFNKSASSQRQLGQLLRNQYALIDNKLTTEINKLVSFETNQFINARNNLLQSRDQVIKHIAFSSLIPLLVVFILILVIRSLLEKGKEAHRETLRAVKSRDDVLAVVSHDLKNPLAIVILSFELLKKKIIKDKIEDERINKSVDSIGRAAQVMKDLIQNLLDQVKIEAGALELNLQKENISEVIKESELLFDSIANERSITIVNQLPHGPLDAYCDKKRLMQILSNLIGNAIKFLNPGGKISVKATKNEQNVVITITDNGPGIPSEELPHLFDRYWQAKKTANKGTGLGLSIVKGLVEAHGGKVWVSSQLSVGSTFSFTLPTRV